MANKILIARGTKARIETIKGTLETYEVVYATDTGELGVKKADGNIEYFMNATAINEDIATKEDSANKVNNLNTPNNITFGTTLAVKTYVDTVVSDVAGLEKHDIVLIPDTAFTITQAHFNKTLIITSSSNVTITVPTQIVENIERGFFCDIVRYGTGEVVFSGAGIVLNSAGALSIDGQYIAASLIKIDNNNEWLLIGGRE